MSTSERARKEEVRYRFWKSREKYSPALNEILPYIVLQLVSAWQFLDKVLNGVLSQPKEVGS